MIKFILNGFQRSGTTLMWKLMKRSNPGMIHLYEPFQETVAEVEKFEDKVIRIHGDKVWKDYSYLPPSVLEKLKQKRRELKSKVNVNNLNFSYFYPTDIKEVSDYLDLINGIDKPVTLQLNRGALILPELSEKYKCSYAHIIRNPYDVWISFMKPLTSDGWRSFARKHVFMRTYGYYWDLDNIYNFLKRYDDSVPEIKKGDYVGKFVVNWSYINYYAIKKLDNRGIAFWVEDLNEENLKKLEQHSGIKFDLSTVKYSRERLMHSNKLDLRSKVKEQIEGKVEELGLQKMVGYVNNFKSLWRR